MLADAAAKRWLTGRDTARPATPTGNVHKGRQLMSTAGCSAAQPVTSAAVKMTVWQVGAASRSGSRTRGRTPVFWTWPTWRRGPRSRHAQRQVHDLMELAALRSGPTRATPSTISCCTP